MKYDPRIAQLRFLAAFSVALYHLWTLKIIPSPLFRPGWLGVPLFFELSIFLLLSRLDDNPSLSHYFKRRIWRIWPLYFSAVVVAFLADRYVLDIGPSLADLFLHFVFLSFIVAPFSFQYLFWSLQLEEWMYLFIPLIHRLSDRGKLNVAIGLIFITLAYSLIITQLPYDVFHLLYFMPPFWLGAYGWGIIAYIMKKNNVRFPSPLPYIAVVYTAYVAVAVVVHDERLYELWTRFVLYNVTLVLFMVLIVEPPKVFHRITVFLGEVSYGIYLWTLLFQELFGLAGVVAGILAAVATEFPLRKKEIIARISRA